MSKSSIEWTESTWNPVTGCSKVSAGCKNCYAERMAYRLGCMGQSRYQTVIHNPDTIPMDKIGTWIGNTHFVESALSIPLKRKKATTYFVCSMSDLFHPTVPDEWIFRVFAVMAKAGWHTYQILTKRPERMPDILQKLGAKCDGYGRLIWKYGRAVPYAQGRVPSGGGQCEWPLKNMWLGTTAEDQQRLEERVIHLLKCPASLLFLSIEPMLAEMNLTEVVVMRKFEEGSGGFEDRPVKMNVLRGYGIESPMDDEKGKPIYYQAPTGTIPKLGWVIVGAESRGGGIGRECRIEWVRSIVEQCKAAGVPVFVKQLHLWGKTGSNRLFEKEWIAKEFFRSSVRQVLVKDMREFPDDLRVREVPVFSV